MKNYKKIEKLIQQSNDYQTVVETLLKLILQSEDCDQSRHLVHEVEKKIELLSRKNKESGISRRSMHSERLTAMGQMAAAISHELRNPLSGIKVAAEYVMRKVEDDHDVSEIINNIHNEVIFANNIISNILEHARLSEPQFKRSSLKRVVEEAILTVAQQGRFNNIKITKQIPSQLPTINLDSMQIRQVFMNLFNNSAEAMLGGGDLKVKIILDEDSVIIKVSDSGSGIDKDHLDKLFEPFFTTKVKGTGLGLAITKEIIENHNGQISVQSKVDKGTIFTIRLPAVKPKTKKEQES